MNNRRDAETQRNARTIFLCARRLLGDLGSLLFRAAKDKNTAGAEAAENAEKHLFAFSAARRLGGEKLDSFAFILSLKKVERLVA